MAARAKPAASIIAVWQGPTGTARVFMGRRHESLRFLPGFLVFPGGRIEAQDRQMTAFHLADRCATALDLEGGQGTGAFVRAALRECEEETGLAIAPHLAGPLQYVARAITPPALPVRYDTRFFLAKIVAGTAPPQPLNLGDGELLSPDWYDEEALKSEKLHHVTLAVLHHALAINNAPKRPVERLLVADRKPKAWRGLPPLRSRDLKALNQDI